MVNYYQIPPNLNPPLYRLSHQLNRPNHIPIIQMGIARAGLDPPVAKKPCDHGQGLRLGGGMAGIGVTQIVHSHIPQFGQLANPVPEVGRTDRSGVDLWVVEDPLNAAPPGQAVENRPTLLPNPDGSWSSLAVA